MITSKFRAPRGRLPATAIQTGTDTWTSREKICLVEAIQSLGNEDWNEVSKYIHELTKSTRTKEWCSPLNCSRQFHCMMESVGRQLRRRGDGDKDILTALRQHFVNERVNEINILAEDSKQKFMNLFKFNKEVEAGAHDDRVGEILTAYGTEATLEQDQQQQPPPEEENNGFYFSELADLNEKVSLINQFIQEQIGMSSQPKEEEKLPEASASTTLGDEDEDLADLADIFPDMETFNPEDLDETLIENTEFEMMSPPDSTPTSRKAPPTSPKVSPQLKNLVRTAIAGTSEDDRPRNLTPSAGAPTLSMLLEMPPRDPGQPLPEIGTVTKAASTAQEPSRQDRVSPYRSPSAATLEQLNIALANSPTRHQDHQVKSKSSSPTLQRLLEGTMPLKKDTDDRLSAFASSFSFIPTEEIKQEVETIASTSSDSGTTATSILLPPVASSPRKFPPEVPSVTVNPVEAIVEQKPNIVEVEAQASQAAQPTGKETETPVEIKEEKEEAAEVQETSALQPEEPMEVQPLPPDVQTKVNNLKDLVIIQNKGTVTPKGSPEKKDAEIAVNAPTIEKQTLPAAVVSAQESAADAEIKEEAASPDVTEERESVSMPVLQPVVELVPLSLADVKGVKIVGDKPVQLKTPAEPMDVDEAYETPPEEPTESAPRKESTTATGGDSDEELPSRKKSIPAKTYSRKERYGDAIDMDEDDSSNSGVDAARKSRSPSRNSPARSTRTPPKQTEVKRGRKSRVSESVSKQADLDSKEEALRITRARSKPGTPQKAAAPKTPAVSTTTTSTPTTTTTKTPPEPETEPVPLRSTRSRASTVPSQAEASVKKSSSSGEDKDVSIISDDHHSTPGRATRGRISSTTKLLDSLPAVPLESNPSSPSSSTTTSTTMMDHEDKEQRAFRKSISILWDQIKSHKHAGQFLKPITDTAVPSYSKKVLRPMDLTTIKRNIDNGMIRNIQIFERDIYLMLMNATMYNSSEHEIHQRTLQMEEDVRTMLESFKATQKALRQAQMVESLGPDPAHRSPVKLRSSARRSQKISDSDADDLHADELHSGVPTPQSTSDHETDDTDASRTKTRESSPDITSGVSVSSGMKRRSRAAAAKAERTGSSDSKTRNQSPDVNASGHS